MTLGMNIGGTISWLCTLEYFRGVGKGEYVASRVDHHRLKDLSRTKLLLLSSNNLI